MIDDVPHLREYMESENFTTAKTVVKTNDLNYESTQVEQIPTSLKASEALIATLTCSSSKHTYNRCYVETCYVSFTVSVVQKLFIQLKQSTVFFLLLAAKKFVILF